MLKYSNNTAMEHINKQQIILLGAFVSFVTSIATAVFTVSLMSQMPQGVAQTVTNVVEKTIEKVVTVPDKNANKPVLVSVDEQLVSAAKIANDLIVAIYTAEDMPIIPIKLGSSSIPTANNSVKTGVNPITLGTIVSSDGYIAVSTDLSTTHDDLNHLVAVFSNGERIIIDSEAGNSGNDELWVHFLKVKELPAAIKKNFTQNTFTYSEPKLGQAIFALKKLPEPSLLQGNVVSLRSSDGAVLVKGLARDATDYGSPIFNLKGEIVGLKALISADNTPKNAFLDDSTMYIPMKYVYSLLQKFK